MTLLDYRASVPQARQGIPFLERGGSIMGIKRVVLVLLFVSGIVLLVLGYGAGIPLVKYKEWEVQSVPAGVVLLADGILIAWLWKVKYTKETTVTTSPDGGSTTTTREDRTEVR